MRFFIFMMVLLISASVFAQGVDWDKIGRPLGEDTKDIKDRYVYFDESKIADPNVSLSKPLLSLQGMGVWIESTIPQIMTLSVHTYNQDLKAAKPYFTDKGFRAFVAFLDENKINENVIQNSLDLTMVLEGPPNILADAVFQDVYRWNVDVPLVLSYKGRSAAQSKVTINVDIVRVPFGQNSDGLAIDHWQIRQNENSVIEEKQENPVDDGLQDAYQ